MKVIDDLMTNTSKEKMRRTIEPNILMMSKQDEEYSPSNHLVEYHEVDSARQEEPSTISDITIKNGQLNHQHINDEHHHPLNEIIDSNNIKDLEIIEEEIFPEESCDPKRKALHNTVSNVGLLPYKANSIPRRNNSKCVNSQNEKNQLRMRAALNGHVIFSHHPNEMGQIYHVEWWYYLSTFDHTMIPFFKHSQDGDTSIVQIGNAIHCRDYQLKLVDRCKSSNSNKGAVLCECCNNGDDLSHFWSIYYFDNQHRIITQSPTSNSMDSLYNNSIHPPQSRSVNGGGHENSMIEDEDSLFEFDTTSQEEEEMVNFEHWDVMKHNHEEPQMDDHFDTNDYFQSLNDEDYMADISTMSSPYHRNETTQTQDEISHTTDSRANNFSSPTSQKGKDEDISQSSLDTKDDEMLSLDQFIESSSYHINEQFKIISREFSRIFF